MRSQRVVQPIRRLHLQTNILGSPKSEQDQSEDYESGPESWSFGDDMMLTQYFVVVEVCQPI